jgi:hypothetical protein
MPTVQLVEYAGKDGSRLSVQGVHTCKSPLCPFCSRKWQRTRSEEIKLAIDNWEGKQRKVLFATFTFKHHRGMKLALMHRLARDAFGHMWSGRDGQDFAEALGGKPESVRAHDRTWSFEHGWHPHIHALIFLREASYTEAELEQQFFDRWVASLETSLGRFKRFAARVLSGERCKHPESCPCCFYGPLPLSVPRERDCPSLVERARRVFGAKLLPRRESLRDAMVRIDRLLEAFTVSGITPERWKVNAKGEQVGLGVQVEWARSADRASTYLSKLGLELTNSDKLGHVGSDGIVRYGLWEVARLATRHKDPLRVPARRAWSELFRASFGTQTITFSSRDELGLAPDPYAEEGEPEEQDPSETSRLLGSIIDRDWDVLSKAQRHGLHVTLEAAWSAGVLGELPYVVAPTWFQGMPSTHDPPERSPPRPEWWERNRADLAAEQRGRDLAARVASAMRSRNEDRSLFVEELRYKLAVELGEIKLMNEKEN